MAGRRLIVAWPNGTYFTQAQRDGGTPIELAETDLRQDDVLLRVIYDERRTPNPIEGP